MRMKRTILAALLAAFISPAPAQTAPEVSQAPAIVSSVDAVASADTLVAPYQVTIEDATLPDSVRWVSSPWSYGLFIGTGPRWTAGRLNQYFSWAWDFTIGGKLAFNRWYLEASVSFASPTLKKPRMTTAGDPDTKFRANVKNANYTAWGFNVGYAVYDAEHFDVIPFVGGKWTSYSWTSRPVEIDENGSEVMTMPQQKMKVKDFNIDFGINFDWHFASMIVGTDGKRQSLTSSLRLTPYAVRGVYSSHQGGFSGWQLGFMIAYSATARKLKPIYMPD